jgi:hypothetical protein
MAGFPPVGASQVDFKFARRNTAEVSKQKAVVRLTMGALIHGHTAFVKGRRAP